MAAGGSAAEPSALNRLELASRIHQQMLRELGQGIEVERMLTQDRYARDVLLVCDALRGSELAVMAAEFRAASQVVMRPLAPPGHVVQATDWSTDTSGFGPLSRPQPDADLPPPAEPQPERRRGWLNWRRG